MIDKLGKGIMAFLNKAIPAGLAMKGIQKMDPRFGAFATNALSVGYTTDQVLDYLREKIEPGPLKSLKTAATQRALRPDEVNVLKRNEGVDKIQRGIATGAGLIAGLQGLSGNRGETEQAAAQAQQPGEGTSTQGESVQAQNLIAQYSPELAAFIEGHIKRGRDPLEAGALAQLFPKFNKIITKIEKDNKMPFSSILQSMFGMQQGTAQASQANVLAPQGPAGNNADQALMAAIDKILKM